MQNVSELFKVGDVVIPRFANYRMIGTVTDVNDKTQKIEVNFQGNISQVDAMDIVLLPAGHDALSARVATKMIEARTKFASDLSQAIADEDFYTASNLIQEQYPNMSNNDVAKYIQKLSGI